MKIAVTLLCIISPLLARGARNTNETNSAMNGMVLDIDWSGLVHQMQPGQQMPVAQPAPVVYPTPVAEPMPEPGVQVAPEFMQISSAAQLQIQNVNTVADLIVRSWANTWSMLAQDPNSTISLIYAAYKPLEGVEGVHWRLVFSLSGSGNTEFVALDVAVLANGMIDIFRNIQTRNLTDISVLFGVNVSAGHSIALEYLKESFFHNAPMMLNPNYNAAQANQSSFNIEWTTVQLEQVQPQQHGDLNVLLNNLGGDQKEYGVLETNVDIGKGNNQGDFNMYG